VAIATRVAALCLLLAACAPPQHRLAAAADAEASVPPTTYRSVLSGYRSQRPVEPASWREQNERVAPRRDR
jgi:hypothetical protein